jgi:hypothetical protein
MILLVVEVEVTHPADIEPPEYPNNVIMGSASKPVKFPELSTARILSRVAYPVCNPDAPLVRTSS